jgi:hypothetical protein
MMKLYAPFIREATLRVTMTLRSEGHGGDPSPKLQGGTYKYMSTSAFSISASSLLSSMENFDIEAFLPLDLSLKILDSSWDLRVH